MVTDFGVPALLGMFGLGHYELLIVAAVALLLFGHRLPSLMRSLGSGVTQFKKGMSEDPDVELPFDEKAPAKGEKHVGV